LRSLALAESSSGGLVLNKLVRERKIALIGVYSLKAIKAIKAIKAEPTHPERWFYLTSMCLGDLAPEIW
jgi:hypothetical protein